MKINLEHSLESEIPFQSLHSLSFDWGINRHATMEITGILKSDCPDSVWSRNYLGTEAKLYQNHVENGDPVLFHGLIQAADLKKNHGIGEARIRVSSASVKLDNGDEKLCEGFQDPEQSYSEIAKQTAKKKSGNVICPIGQEKINKPIICYQETAWEFLKRIASHQGGYLMPDIKTGKPSLWFGMREGKKVAEEILETSLKIEIERSYGKEEGVARKSYIWESTNGYSIGDWATIDGKKCVIYGVHAKLEHGTLDFKYRLSAIADLKTSTYFNENFVGMSLWGEVQAVKDESVKLVFEMDQKEGIYFYPWRPETGNSLYAVPEVGARVGMYFMDQDERNGIVVRCQGASGEEREPEKKTFRIPEDGVLTMDAARLETKKKGETMSMSDSREVGFSGNKIDIDATGKIKIRSKKLILSAESEIKGVSEGN